MKNPYDDYKDTPINLELSPFLNLDSAEYKYIRPSAYQNIEGLALLLGYAYEEVKDVLPELGRHLAGVWYAAHAVLPMHQIYSYWSEDDAFTQEQQDAEASLDSAHPFADCLVAVYPQTPIIRRAVDSFLSAKGFTASLGDRTWQDWKGFDAEQARRL